MKVKQFKFKHILKLHLLNSQAYEVNSKKAEASILTDSNLIRIIKDFKKILHVIFEYHKANRQILFIGMPKSLESKINRLTCHVAVGEQFELQGVILNNFTSSKSGESNSPKSSLKSLIPKLSKKPQLVVFSSHQKKRSIVAESRAAKVPIIVLDSSNPSEGEVDQGLYNSRGLDHSGNPGKNLFSFGLNFLFKRA